MPNQVSDTKKTRLVPLAVGMLAGIPYLLATPAVQPAELPYAMMAVVQVILLIAGFVVVFVQQQRAHQVALLLVLGILVVVLGRMIIDSLFDKGSHNMAPFEFITAILLCAPMSFVSSYFGQFVRHLISKRRLTSN